MPDQVQQTLIPAMISSEKPIVVMHFIHTMAYGGVETNILNWIRKMDPDRFKVHLVCFANPGETEQPFIKAAENYGISVATIPWARRKPFFKAAWSLKKLIGRHQVDILHTHNCYANVVGLIVSKLTPVKTVTTAYVWAKFNWKRDLIQALDIFVTRRFDWITAHCEQTRENMIRYGISPERVSTLICGFESNRLELSPQERMQKRREMGIEEGQIILGNFARFFPEKAQDALLRCFKEIHRQCPETRLWIFGVGPLEEELKTLCHELGLDPIVTFQGFTSDLPLMMALVDIQVHPSHMEGVPLAICSGMAAGLPLVVTGVGGIPEVLENEKTGLLIPPDDEKAFSKAVIRLIRNPDEAKALGAAARRFIENDYSLDTAVRRVENTYREMMKSCG